MPRAKPQPEPGELTLDGAAQTPTVRVGKERLRQLAKSGDVPCRTQSIGPGAACYFFKPNDLEVYFSNRPARRRKQKPAPAPASDEVAYLRQQIARQEGRQDEWQDELTKAQVRWATAEARIDELTRKCAEQQGTIETLTAAIARASRLEQDLGN